MSAATDLPETLKLTACAKALGVTSKEFRALCARHSVPVLRPSERRERILREHFEQIVCSIAGHPLARAPGGNSPVERHAV
jgi:hypothetical protein